MSRPIWRYSLNPNGDPMRGMRPPVLFCCIALVLPTSLAAQSPVISPAGDPTILSDTIYALAVDPADHPDDPYVLLLDDGVVRYEKDGTGTRTYRQVVQILTQDAVDNFAEQAFSYAPGHQRVRVNWLRVLRPDGSPISDTPEPIQDADIPARRGDPVYTNQKVRRYSLAGVTPGTLVDISYSIEELQPWLAGDFYRGWGVHSSQLVRRSRYIVDLPASMKVNLQERNLTFPRTVQEYKDRRIYAWITQEVERITPEDFAADSNGVYMGITVSGSRSWGDIARWYADLSKDRYTIPSEVEALLPGLLNGALSSTDTLRALQRWIAQDIRYVSISLGIGGYQPRPPAEVVSTGYGDCKDKATLFVALARRLGFRADPVLLSSGVSADRALPSLEQFDHEIAVVHRKEGPVYVDLTADLVPWGGLPGADQGMFALIVHRDGSSEEVTLPLNPPEANVTETRISGRVTADGLVTASYLERTGGTRQPGMRNLFTSPVDSSHRAAFARAIAARIFPGAEADSLQIFDGRDLTAEPRVALRILNGRGARAAGAGTMILTLPFGSMRALEDAAAELEAKGPRRFTIDAAGVIGPTAVVWDLTLALPGGWTVHLPENVSVDGKWGRFVAEYSQHADTLHIVRRLVGARGVYPPSDLPDLLAWLRAVARDDVPYLVVDIP